MINIANLLNRTKKEEIEDLEEIVNNIRALGLDMIDNAGSGHPGILLGSAPIITTLYANHLKINQKDDKWINRDRFILSAGHGSALLYSTLFMSGYDITLEDLKKFRKLDSKTPGHPEYNVTPGVDLTTGPLGTGFATSVGMAIAETYLRNYFGKDLIDYYTYVLCSDGDLMEGISYEAASLAGHLNLNKLILLYDSNNISLDGKLNLSFSENIKERFISANWNYILVDDGENTTKIDDAINRAKSNKNGPTIIEIKTIIGKHSKKEGTHHVHGSALDKDDILNIKEKLDVRTQPFSIPQDLKEKMTELINIRNNEELKKWEKNLSSLEDDKKSDLELLQGLKKIKLKNMNYEVPESKMDSLRNMSSVMINSIADNFPFFMGGSADLSSSTKSKINDSIYSKENRSGRTINFGVREGLMGAIANGLAISNIIPFVSTFLAFSDFLRPSIRLAAMMNLPVIYVFTHDSITVGEDGRTHQPVEQLVSLRSIPNLDVYRPADSNEVIGTYKTVMERKRPSAIIISRNNVLIEDNTDGSKIEFGGYITNKEEKKLEGIIISSGEEFSIAKEVYEKLTNKGYGMRLVSMPSASLFEQTSKEYQEEVLPKNIKTFVIELSSPMSWYKYVDNEEYLFTVNEYGFSGSKEEILNKLNFNENIITEKIENMLRK